MITGAGTIRLGTLFIGEKPNKQKPNRIIRDGKSVKPAFSAEHRARLSAAHMGQRSALGHKVSKTARLAMSVGHIGMKTSDETRKKMSLIHKGVVLGPVPEERRQRIRDTVNAYYAEDPANRMRCAHGISEENRRIASIRQSGYKNMLGKHHTQETKDKVSKAKSGKPNGITYTDELRKKMSEIKKKYFSEHPEAAEEMKQRWADPEYKSKMLAIFNDPEYSKNRSQLHKDIWGRPGFKEKMIERENIYSSKPEDVMALILEGMGISYKRQYPIRNIPHFFPADFYIEKWNIIIEVDGRYFHNLPGRQERDRIRNEEVRAVGYHILRFWDDELEDENKIIFDIENEISNIDCSFFALKRSA